LHFIEQLTKYRRAVLLLLLLLLLLQDEDQHGTRVFGRIKQLFSSSDSQVDGEINTQI
jgi:hypothetical protein